MDVASERNGSDSGSSASASPGSRGSSSASRPPETTELLLAALERQSRAMERLAELLPQLVAVNQALIEAVVDRDEQAEEPPQYLDGSPR